MGYLSERIGATLSRGADTRAVQFKGRWWSWAELGDIVRGLDEIFKALELAPGTAIGCALRNRPEHAAAMMGVVIGGRCLVTLNALLPDDKLAADIAAARPPVLVASAEDWEREAVRAASVAIGAAGVALTGDPVRPVERVTGLELVGAGPHQAPMPDIAVLMLTSGTTGAPKRVPLKMAVLERQLVEAAGGQRYATPEEAPPPTDGAAIVHSSFVHIAGVWSVFGAAMAGRPIRLLEKFNVSEWHQAVIEHRPRASGGPPAALRMILDANIPKEDLSSLVSLGAGTAPLDPAIVDEFLARYDLPVLSNYGATEFAGGVASWSLRAFRDHWSAKRGAVGRIHKTIDARVVDPDTDEPVADGSEGILELKGFAIGDGEAWIRTTDRAVMDADRFLWIKGRADNAIIRGGFKIHPDDVVQALQSHPAVLEASVAGMPDRRLGEVPVAALILKAGAKRPADGELADWVRSRLMAYCVPAAFKVVDELPRTPSLKVSTPAVCELFAESPASA